MIVLQHIHNQTVDIGDANRQAVDISNDYNNSIALGDGNHDTARVIDESYFDTITLGNGVGDCVLTNNCSDAITLGDGARDRVQGNLSDATVTLGNGAHDTVDIGGSAIINVGDGNHDTVRAQGGGDLITVGDGNHDVVDISKTNGDSVTIGNGNHDTIDVGMNAIITVGTGHDSFVFEETQPGCVGAVTIAGFNPEKDSITFSSELTTAISYHDNAQGNAVIDLDHHADTIELLGVHSVDLHPGDFHFVDHAHSFLL